MSNNKLSSEKGFSIEMYILISVVFSARKKKSGLCVCLGTGETVDSAFPFSRERKRIHLVHIMYAICFKISMLISDLATERLSLSSALIIFL